MLKMAGPFNQGSIELYLMKKKTDNLVRYSSLCLMPLISVTGEPPCIGTSTIMIKLLREPPGHISRIHWLCFEYY